MNVKGLIFAAGIGSRLRPLTDITPKALIEVGGKTMLERTILRLRNAGITDIFINIHHHASQIREWVEANRKRLGVNITLSDESNLLLDTGGGLLKAFPLLECADAIVLHNADIYTDISVARLLDCHLNSKADVTLATAIRDTSRYLLFDEEDQMRGWMNVATNEVRPSDTANAEALNKRGFCGVHVVSPNVFSHLEEYSKTHGQVFSMTPFYIENVNHLRIKGEDFTGNTWVDIGKPESLALAREMAAQLS